LPYLKLSGIGILVLFSLSLLTVIFAFLGLILRCCCTSAGGYSGKRCLNIFFHLGWCIGWLAMLLFFILAFILFPLGIMGGDGCDFVKDIYTDSGKFNETMGIMMEQKTTDMMFECIFPTESKNGGDLSAHFGVKEKLQYFDDLLQNFTTIEQYKILLDNSTYRNDINITKNAFDYLDVKCSNYDTPTEYIACGEANDSEKPDALKFWNEYIKVCGSKTIAI